MAQDLGFAGDDDTPYTFAVLAVTPGDQGRWSYRYLAFPRIRPIVKSFSLASYQSASFSGNAAGYSQVVLALLNYTLLKVVESRNVQPISQEQASCTVTFWFARFPASFTCPALEPRS